MKMYTARYYRIRSDCYCSNGIEDYGNFSASEHDGGITGKIDLARLLVFFCE